MVGKATRLMCLCLVIFFTMACSTGTNEPENLSTVEESVDIRPLGDAVSTIDNLVVRVDSVSPLEISDIDGTGEFYFATLAIRSGGESRKLIAPGNGVYQISNVNQEIPLDQFSIGINRVGHDEKIVLYFLAMESDEQGTVERTGADLALEVGIALLEKAIESGVFTKNVKPTHAGIIAFIAGQIGGAALEWWREPDIVDGAVVILEPANDWRVGQSYEVVGDNKKMKLKFTVLEGDTTIISADAPKCPLSPPIQFENGIYQMLPLNAIANDTLGAYGDPPTGDEILGGVPFCISVAFGTQGDFLRDRPTASSLIISPPLNNAEVVYILLNSGNTFTPFTGQEIGSVELQFTGGEIYTTPLIAGDNIREWQYTAPNIIGTATNPNLQQVFDIKRGGIDFAVLDMLQIPLPPEFQNLPLELIAFRDSSVENLGDLDPGFFIGGVTIKQK